MRKTKSGKDIQAKVPHHHTSELNRDLNDAIFFAGAQKSQVLPPAV